MWHWHLKTHNNINNNNDNNSINNNIYEQTLSVIICQIYGLIISPDLDACENSVKFGEKCQKWGKLDLDLVDFRRRKCNRCISTTFTKNVLFFFYLFYQFVLFRSANQKNRLFTFLSSHKRTSSKKQMTAQHQKMYQKHFNIIFNFETRFSHTHRRNSNDNFWILFCFCLSFAVEIERNNTCRVISHQQEIRNRNRESAMRKREREITPLFSLWKTDFLRVDEQKTRYIFILKLVFL